MEAQARWLKVPTSRHNDVFAITATNSSVYGNSSNRYGSFYYSHYFSKTGGVEYLYYDTTQPGSRITEYSFDGFAVRVDLPGDIIGLGASVFSQEFEIRIGCAIYNANAFNVYTAYGHMRLTSSASITSGGGVTISFDNSTSNYAGSLLTALI